MTLQNQCPPARPSARRDDRRPRAPAGRTRHGLRSVPPARHGASTPSPARLPAGSPCSVPAPAPPGRRPAGPRAGERRAGSADRSRRAGGAAAVRSAPRAPPPAGTGPASGRHRRAVSRRSTPPRTSAARAIAPAPSGSRAADRRAVRRPSDRTASRHAGCRCSPDGGCPPELARLGAQRGSVVFGSHSAKRRSTVGRGSSIPQSGFPATRKGLHASPMRAQVEFGHARVLTVTHRRF